MRESILRSLLEAGEPEHGQTPAVTMLADHGAAPRERGGPARSGARRLPLDPGDGVSMSTSGSFLRSRLGSFLAFAPLSFWTILHLWQNLNAFRGAAAWEREVTEYSHPVAMWATFAVVLLPILVHAAWGTWRVITVRPNLVRYPYFGNLKFVLQRISAIGILLFIGAHLWLATIHPRLSTGRAEPFSDISHQMRHHLPTLVVYLLGTLGVAYHLANGLQTFAMGWGIVTRRRAQKVLDWAALVLFVVLLAMSWAVVYALWAAGA